LICCERCYVISKLVAERWGYLKKYPEYHPESVQSHGNIIIDITRMVEDSNILGKIRFSMLDSTLMRILNENNIGHMFQSDNEIEAWRPLIDLLVPPENFWESSVEYVD
tara:strand:+ start:19868 stop:20194 length:327 start_codon:yes stop_codon:yes gene_type:complete